MRTHLSVAIFTLCGAALLTACSHQSGTQDAAVSTATVSSVPSTTTTTVTAAPAPSSTETATSDATSAAATSTSSGDGSKQRCATSQLNVQIGAGPGQTMNQNHISLNFTNTSQSECTLNGHPGVSFVAGAQGQQVGAPAERTGDPTRVVLAAGATAHADLVVVSADVFDPAQCQPVDVAGLRVYPPDQTAAVFVPFSSRGCTSQAAEVNPLSIGAVQQGPGTP